MLSERKAIQNLKPYTPGQEIAGNIKLASNENPLGSSPLALEGLAASLKESSIYPDGNCTLLKEKLSKKLGVKPENLVIGNGSDEVLLLIAGAYLNPGDEVVIAKTTFSEYEFSARLFGASATFMPLKNMAYDLATMAMAITSKTKIIYLCNPNNPTGTIFTTKELEDFFNKISKDILVVIDEAYFEYVVATDYPKTLELINSNNIIVLRTFSKIYGLAGLRIGYGIANPKIINSLNKAREPFNVNRLAQIAATAALDDQKFIKESLKINEAGKKYMYSELGKLGLKYYPTEANFIFVEVPTDGTQLSKQLMAKGITIRPMASFGCPNAIRVTVGTLEQNTFFVEKLKACL